MIIATFGESTSWVGKTITFDNGVFTLEGHGHISATDVLAYDHQGHLQWAQADMRGWVAGQAQPPVPDGRPTVVANSSVREQSPRKARSFPTLAFVLVAVIGVAILVLVAIVLPMRAGGEDQQRVSSVKEGIHALQIGAQSWAIDHGDLFPDPSVMQVGSFVDDDGLEYLDPWPTNPYTGLPMSQGTAPGDFTYTVSADRTSHELAGYGEGGKTVITFP